MRPVVSQETPPPAAALYLFDNLIATKDTARYTAPARAHVGGAVVWLANSLNQQRISAGRQRCQDFSEAWHSCCSRYGCFPPEADWTRQRAERARRRDSFRPASQSLKEVRHAFSDHRKVSTVGWKDRALRCGGRVEGFETDTARGAQGEIGVRQADRRLIERSESGRA